MGPRSAVVGALRPAAAACREHAVVLVHGLDGEPSDFATLAALAARRHPRAQIHAAQSLGLQRDGIVAAGRRLADELEQLCAPLASSAPPLLSIVGHSNGGLVARYALGELEARGALGDGVASARMSPNAFVTLSSPHLGVRRSDNAASPFESEAFQPLVRRIVTAGTYGHAGVQLAMLDADGARGAPLLVELADADGLYVRALRRFHRRVAVASVSHEILVPFGSAALLSGPAHQSRRSLDRAPRLAPNVVSHTALQPLPPPPPRAPSTPPPLLPPRLLSRAEQARACALSARMVHGLRSAGTWHRVVADFRWGVLGWCHWLTVGKGVPRPSGVPPAPCGTGVTARSPLRARERVARGVEVLLAAARVGERSRLDEAQSADHPPSFTRINHT